VVYDFYLLGINRVQFSFYKWASSITEEKEEPHLRKKMNPTEQISEEWSSLSGFCTAEEADFMSQLLGNCSLPENLSANFHLGIPSATWPGHESTIVTVTSIDESPYFPTTADNSTYLCFSQGSSSTSDSSNIFPTTNGNKHCFNDPYMSLGFAKFSPYNVQGSDTQQMNENTDQDLGQEVIADKNSLDHQECEVLVSEAAKEGITINLEKSGKRSRGSMQVE